MKTPLKCLIFGHKWFNKKDIEYYDSYGRKWREKTEIERKTCSRCGEKNPIFIK